MNTMELLPPRGNIETKAVLKKAAEAHRYLAELKGVAQSIPNQNILIDTLSLQEARDSSAIENIISTFDDIYQSNAKKEVYISANAKEVHAYAQALKVGFELVKKTGLITNNHIIKIQSTIEKNKAGYRKLPGTKLLNEATGETIFTPPQDYDSIVKLMENLQEYINYNEMSDADPLVKMAVIHHRFESIHPFYDGNGRTGRIINILYLIKNELLSLPILYLSRYIIKHKADYYRLLQEVRDKQQWESWILFMLNAVSETSKNTILVINGIATAMQQYKIAMRENYPKIYSRELLNNLFRFPYTKIEYLMSDLKISRNTAIRYLEQLEKADLIAKKKVGRDNYYINKSLIELLISPK